MGSLVEVSERLEQEVLGRDEVGVEDRDELARGHLQAGFERARLVTRAVDTVQILDVEAARGVSAHGELGDLGGLVRRVVQHLDLEQVAGIVDLADGIDQAVRDVHLVEDGELDGDPRQHLRRRQRGRHVALVFHVKIHKVIAMPAVDGEDAQNEEVQDENQRISKRHRINESANLHNPSY